MRKLVIFSAFLYLVAAQAKCGGFGQDCCLDHKCTQGTCLQFASKVVGTCSSFAGIFLRKVQGKETLCQEVNFYTAECKCPPNFQEMCYSNEEDEFCVCQSDTHSKSNDFGGIYQLEGKNCLKTNPITGRCTCPEGTSPKGPVGIYNKKKEIETYLCLESETVFASFAGLFQEGDNGACLFPNPFTGGCSCPSKIPGNSQATSCPSVFASQESKKLGAMVGTCNVVPVGNGGVQMSVSEEALERVLTQGLDEAVNGFSSFSVPNQSGKDWHAKGISFKQLTFSTKKISVSSPNSIKVLLEGGKMDGEIKSLEVKKLFISAHCEIKPFDLEELSLEIEINTDFPFLSGHPYAYLSSKVTAKCGKVNIDVHGHELCHLFKHDIEKQITSSVTKGFESDVAPVIETSVNKEGEYLAGNLSAIQVHVPYNTRLYGKLLFDLSTTGCGTTLLPSPSLLALTVNLRGSFFTPKMQIEPPFQPNTFPAQTPTTKHDVIFCMSDYVLNSLGWTLWENQFIQIPVTSSFVPPDSPLQFNTSNFIMQQLAPGMTTQFPNKGMELIISSTSVTPNTTAPKVELTQGGIDLSWDLVISFNVLTSPPQTAFSLQLGLNTNVTLSTTITPKAVELVPIVDYLQFTWKLDHSNVGSVNVALLSVLDSFIVPSVIQVLNGYFHNNTISIPTSYESFTFADIELQFYQPTSVDHFVCVSANLKK